MWNKGSQHTYTLSKIRRHCAAENDVCISIQFALFQNGRLAARQSGVNKNIILAVVIVVLIVE